ncbi:MAG TPA: M20/M25/M40 family metallo-hydrolase [Terriglobales bacterium]|jgi:carboxypeptidase Q|nr:M20/M25/M40 family metallo-hydrolase [Terriglobales bacterium]
MKKLALTLVLLGCAIPSAWTQPKSSTLLVTPAPTLPKELSEQLQAIRDAALSSDYAWQQLAHLTENIGPRPAGSPQAQAASEYVAAELRKLGLDVHLEEATVSHWVRGEEKAELVEFPGQLAQARQKIILTALSGGAATPAEGITGDVIVVHNFAELTALGHDKVAGRIVLFNVRYDSRKAAAGYAFDAYGDAVVYRAKGGEAVAALGGSASLVRSVGGAEYRLPHTGFSYPANVPAAALAAEDADLIDHLAAQGRVRMHLTLTPQRLPDTTGFNVVADIKGTEHPEQIVVVSGHLDSWDLGRGAIDDGAGVVISMATAEILQRLHIRPRRTLRVIAWMDEENGGGGHDAYGKSHASEMPNHIAAIESDAGAGHPLGFSVKASTAATASLRSIIEVLQPVGATVIRPTTVSPGSDIEPLVDAGVPGLGIIQDGRKYFDYHHTPADTLDKVDPQELRENAAAMAVMGYALAAMPEPLQR